MLAKTSRPRVVAAYRRSRLFDRFDSARRQHAATFISGPPGAGKTTLVASYLNFRKLPCLWYQVDSGDEDVATFFHYFSNAAAGHLRADVAQLPEFDPGKASDLTRFAHTYFREIYSRQADPLVVVFDNYHELGDDSPLHDVVEVACREAPENCHIVIASRLACPGSLARLRLHRALEVIGPEDLNLTLDETRGIAEFQGVKIASQATMIDLHARSAGWMMGLMLALEGVRSNGATVATGMSAQGGQGKHVFDYFLGEVLRKLDPGDRDLLVKSALFPKMTVSRVVQLTGTERAGMLLNELLRRNHFVTCHGGREAAYQFHPLFQEFLLEQGTARYREAEIASLRCKAAQILRAEGDNEAAIALLEQAGDWPGMAKAILAAAPMLCAQGRLATLDTWTQKLPAEIVDADPWLLYWQASGKAISDPQASQLALENAYRRFRDMADLTGMALSWAGLMDAIFHIHRDFQQLDDWIVEFNVQFKHRLGLLYRELRLRVTLVHFVALSFRQPLHPDMPFWLASVRTMLQTETRAEERSSLRQHLVTYHLLRGEHAEAESVLTMLHYAADLPEAERPSRTVIDHINEAVVAMHAGMGERCLRAVAEGLRAAQGTGNRLFDSDLLQLGAAMSLNRGDLGGADKFLAAFERLAEAIPFVDRGAYYAVAAWRKFQSGEPALALQLLGRAVAASEARGTPYYIAVDNLGFGLLLHLCGRSREAARHLELGRKVGADIENPLIEYAFHLFSAYVELESGAHSKARVHLASGMRIGRQHGYMHFFFFPPKVISRLCCMALEAGIEADYVRALVQRNELAPDPGWRQAESWPWRVRIYTLGRFGVVRQGVSLRFSGKAQKKPLELLKALIAFGGRDVLEARLADALWPEAEGDAAAQSLATTLFRLRKLLGEEVIRRQENRLTLDPSFCWVDCWAFERIASDDSAAVPIRLAKLRQLHQGPFLDGADDAPWAQPLRARLHAKLARFLNAVTATLLIGVSAWHDKDSDFFPVFVFEFLL